MENIFVVKIQKNVNQRKHIHNNVLSDVSHTIKIQNFDQQNLSGFLQGGGGGGASDEVWDRETMFSQLAKRSIRGLVSGLPRRRCVFSRFQLWL